MTTYYDVLGVSPDSTDEEIKSAYRAQVKDHHPDNSYRADATEVFKDIQQAKQGLDEGDTRVPDPNADQTTDRSLTYDWTNGRPSDEPATETETDSSEAESETNDAGEQDDDPWEQTTESTTSHTRDAQHRRTTAYGDTEETTTAESETAGTESETEQTETKTATGGTSATGGRTSGSSSTSTSSIRRRQVVGIAGALAIGAYGASQFLGNESSDGDQGANTESDTDSETGANTESEPEQEKEYVPVFTDNWEDGDFIDPIWRRNDAESGESTVKQGSPPDGGSFVANLYRTADGGASIFPDKAVEFTGQWRLSGLFTLSQSALDNEPFEYEISIGSDDENASLLLNIYGPTADNRFVDVDSQPYTSFGAGDQGTLIESTTGSATLAWEPDTWYHYEVEHTGEGEYPVRLWPNTESRPEDPTYLILGEPTEDADRNRGFEFTTYYGGPISEETNWKHTSVTFSRYQLPE